MRVAQLLYGRGMPRPIEKVASFAHSIMANYWVAACRDRTSPLPPSSSTFLRAFIFWFARVAQLLYGRGMPRPIAAVTFSAHSIMAYYWVAACRDRTPPLPRIISPLVSLAAVPSSPHLPFVLLTPHTHAVRPEGS